MSLSGSNKTTSNALSSASGSYTYASNINEPENPPAQAEDNPRFCIICCEETEVTQQISAEIEKWNLPDVRSLLLSSELAQTPINAYRHNLPSDHAIAIARSEYAFFITPSEQPCAQIKVNPLAKVCNHRRSASQTLSDNHPPSVLLTALHNCHGQSPQAWWLQLPTPEVPDKGKQPVLCQKSVAQALHQIGIFMRHYQMPKVPEIANNRKKSAAVRKMAADKVETTH